MATSEGEGQATPAPVPAAIATATGVPRPAPMPSMPEASESVLRRVAEVMASAAPTPTPTQIGSYRLHEIIGEGGMGVVFRAEQLVPIRRTVALKLMKPGMFGREALARFHDERQALALMDHPNVARVYDAGASEHGRPYFVMEHVPGESITAFCDRHHYTTRQRLELFTQACGGVQHAHQKAIIHRDLKPSNILVMLQDGKPVVKVIDFGVAKATAQRLTERTMFTETGQLIGTPEYMSPEQAELNQLDVDTRSDIYTLGVVLYELLTGTTPLEHKRAKAASLLEVLRVVREEDPPRPSTRLGAAAELSSIAANRGSEPKRLNGLVKGELDWIVMKALEKDRTRRYETANGLAKDIDRYLHDEAVQAYPPSRVYRVKKFARRNRAALVAAAVMIALLVAGITGTTKGMIRARAETNNALELLGQVRTAKDQAERAAARAQALSRFLSQAFGAANWHVAGGGRDVKVADVLDQAVARLGEELAGQPEAEIDARMAVGDTYTALGLYANSADNFRRAHDLALATYGPEAKPTLKAASGMAWSMVEKGDYRDAEPVARESLATARRVFGTGDPITWDVAETFGFTLSNGWSSRSPDGPARLAEALVIKRELVEWIRRAPPEVCERALPGALHAVALVLLDQGGAARVAEAEQLQREAMTLLRPRRGAPVSPRVQTHFAHTLMLRGKLDESKREFDEALADQRRRLGDTHKTTLTTRVFYANLLLARGEYEDAAGAFEELIALERGGTRVRVIVPREVMMARLLSGLAKARLGLEQPEAALRAAGEVLELPSPPDEPGGSRRADLTQQAWRLRGMSHYRLGDWNAAIEALQKSIELGKGGDSNDFFFLAMAHWQLGDQPSARDWYQRAVTGMEKNKSQNTSLQKLRAEAEALILPPQQLPTTSGATTGPTQ